MKEPGHILIIPSWYPPDGGYFFREHSEAIQRMGWKVDVLVKRWVGIRKLLQLGPSSLRGYRMVDENGLRVIRSPYLKLPGSEKVNIHRWARKTSSLYKRYEKQFGKPDLILAHSATWAGYAASLIYDRYLIPYLIVEHRSFFVWSTERARRMVKPYYLPLFRKAYTNCKKLVLVSDSLRTGIETVLPGIEEKTMVIPNMIREDMFRLPEVLRNTDPFVFIWAGRLEHVKGLDLLLGAAKILSEKSDKPFFINLAGKGSLREELEHQASDLGVAERLRFLGRLSRKDMQQEMQAANCFVLPSRYEAFGVVLIEAMASGLPVIASRSGGPDSIVTPENGLLVEPENIEELSAAMLRMMEQIGEYPAERIREQTLLRYGDAEVMAKYNQLFLQLSDE